MQPIHSSTLIIGRFKKKGGIDRRPRRRNCDIGQKMCNQKPLIAKFSNFNPLKAEMKGVRRNKSSRTNDRETLIDERCRYHALRTFRGFAIEPIESCKHRCAS